jgi:hypothetical protein
MAGQFCIHRSVQELERFQDCSGELGVSCDAVDRGHGNFFNALEPSNFEILTFFNPQNPQILKSLHPEIHDRIRF